MKKIVAILLVLLVAGTMVFAQLYCADAKPAVNCVKDKWSVTFTNMSNSKTITVDYTISNSGTRVKTEKAVILLSPLSQKTITTDFIVSTVDYTATYCD